MHHFQHILFVTLGPVEETAGLRQALGLVHRNRASLKVLACFPEFPKDLQAHRNGFRQSMLEHLEKTVEQEGDSERLAIDGDSVSYEVEFGKTPGLRIIRQVLRNGYDLVIKEAEQHGGRRGFQAVDMELLRKCTCPVWLCRGNVMLGESASIATAIDPEAPDVEGDGLALRLLQLSSSLAERVGGQWNIVSCWDYEYEESLRSSIWYQVPEDELLRTVARARDRSRKALDGLIHRAGLGGNFRLHHLRGQAEELIPTFVEKNDVDLLVMGTVGRTGIPGFLIGNTAENVVQEIRCSLLALKPEGFVCPVKTDS